MSVVAMSWVWEHSQSKGSARLVLLALADHAGADGGDSYPSVARLAARCGLSERAVQGAIRTLVAMGELVVEKNAGPRGTNRYRLPMTPAESAPPQNLHPADFGQDPRRSCTPPPQILHPTPAESAPEPSLNRPEPSKNGRKRPATRAPDEFLVDENLRNWARAKAPDVDLEAETEMWLDHHRAKDSRFADWPASWRRWMRQSQAWQRPTRRNSTRVDPYTGAEIR